MAELLRITPSAELFGDGMWKRLAAELGLTRRQCDVARMICEGGSYKSIVMHANISINTVRMHVRALFNKLGVHDRVELILKLIAAERLLNERWRATGSTSP